MIWKDMVCKNATNDDLCTEVQRKINIMQNDTEEIATVGAYIKNEGLS